LVTRTSISKPSKVDRARERLASAVARLELALPNDDSSNEQLVKQAELTAEIQNLRDENYRLRDVNKKVSDRLDTAIGRFKQAIGE
jgi:hypothetical protein